MAAYAASFFSSLQLHDATHPLYLIVLLVPGINAGIITNCDSSGHIFGADNVGGLVGSNGYHMCEWDGCWEAPGIISESYSTCAVMGSGHGAGGLVGENHEGEIDKSYADSLVLGEIGVGGLVGYNRARASNCYSTADVLGSMEVGPIMTKTNSEQDKIRIIAVDTSTDLARRLTDSTLVFITTPTRLPKGYIWT